MVSRLRKTNTGGGDLINQPPYKKWGFAVGILPVYVGTFMDRIGRDDNLYTENLVKCMLPLFLQIYSSDR